MAIVDERGAAMKFSFSSGDRPLDGFTIKRGLGTGGFGEVYYALTDAGKEVALKHVRRYQEVERRGVSQCLNLKHANLVGVYDIREDSRGDTWIIMEYIADGSLRDVLDKRPNGLPPEELRRWFEGVAAGLGLLHERGLVHRDLKPGNIFQDEGVVKIGDYGLSKLLSTSQVGGQTESVGTFHYTAPEVSRGSYGRAVDIYSLGVILYEMLTGDVPFDGESAQEIIMKHLTATPDWNRVPPAFRPVLEHALAKDPAQRYPNVAEFARSVASAMAGERLVDAQFVSGPNAATPGTGTTGLGPDPEYAPLPPYGMNAPYAANPAYSANAPFGAVPNPAHAAPTQSAIERGFFDDEPVFQFGCDLARTVKSWFTGSQTDKTTQTVLLVVVAIVVYFNAAWILPILSIAAPIYAVYLGVRWLSWPTSKATLPHGGVPGPHGSPVSPMPYPSASYPPTSGQPITGQPNHGAAGYAQAGHTPVGYGPTGSGPAGYGPPGNGQAGYGPASYGPAGQATPGYAPPGYAQPGQAPVPGYPHPGYVQPGYALPGHGYANSAPPGYPLPGAVPEGNANALPQVARAKRPLRVSVRAMTQRKTIRERLREITGSWLMAALVAAFLAVLGTMFFGGGGTRGSASQSVFPEQQSPVQLVELAARTCWLWGATTVGAWIVLLLGKLWERDTGSGAHRRLAMSVFGVLLGVAVAGLANYLGLIRSPLPAANVPLLSELLPINLKSPWVGYPLLYGLLFLTLRWWREAHSLRSTRFSFWNTIVDVGTAFAISQFVSVGNLGQLFLPAAISISVQLSASWIDLDARARFREQITEGDVA